MLRVVRGGLVGLAGLPLIVLAAAAAALGGESPEYVVDLEEAAAAPVVDVALKATVGISVEETD